MVVLSTAPDKKTAKKLSKKLIKNGSACVNLLGKVDSFYFWNDKLKTTREYLMLIKGRYKKIKKIIKKYHPYEVPEILALKPKKIEKNYKIWLKQNSKGKKC